MDRPGNAAVQRDDLLVAGRCYQAGLDAAEWATDAFLVAMAVVNLGYVTLSTDGADRARPLLERSLSIRRELGNPAYVGRTLSYLRLAAHQEGRLEEAQSLLEKAVALLHEVGDIRGLVPALHRAAKVRFDRGDRAGAAPLPSRPRPSSSASAACGACSGRPRASCGPASTPSEPSSSAPPSG